MKKEFITCDECSKDISPQKTSCPRRDILKLSCQNVAINSGAIFAVMLHPLLEEDMYFCGFCCLKNWIFVRYQP